MKVMHLSSSLRHDEAERGIYAITHALIKAGHEAVVIGAVDKEHELVSRLMRNGVVYYQLKMPKKSWLSLWRVLALRRLIMTHNPDVIHVHSRTPAWVLYWALRPIAKDKRPKIVGTVYGFYALTSYDRALFYADAIITASRSIDRYLKEKLAIRQAEQDGEKPPFEIFCVRRGVDIRKYPYRHHASVHWLNNIFAEYPELEHKKWLIFPTPIGAEYGQEWLIDILGNLQTKFPNLHIIITDDELCDDTDVSHTEFVQRLHALNLRNQVTFIGRRPPDMREWLSSANVVLALAKKPESIGITTIQAIHLGTPVVGWAKGAYEDILTATYPQGIVKEETALALCKTIKSHLQNSLRPAMTHEYTIEQMTAETLAVYQSLMPECKLVERGKRDELVCVKVK